MSEPLNLLSGVTGAYTHFVDDDLSVTVSYDLQDDSAVPLSFVTGLSITKAQELYRKNNPAEPLAKLTLTGAGLIKQRIPSGSATVEINDRTVGISVNHGSRRAQFRFARAFLDGRFKLGLNPLVTYGAARRNTVNFSSWVPAYRPLLSDTGFPRREREVFRRMASSVGSKECSTRVVGWRRHGLGVSLRLHTGRNGWFSATVFDGSDRSRLWSMRAEMPLARPSNVSFSVERAWQGETQSLGWRHAQPQQHCCGSRRERVCARNSKVRITSTPLAATLPPLSAILAGRSNRPQGYWKDMYIEKQETHPAKVAARQLQALESQQQQQGRARDPARGLDNVARAFAGRTLNALHPPSAPGLFERDWLRSLLCEGCSLPATTSITTCLHCNVVVHNWCRDLDPSRSRKGLLRRAKQVGLKGRRFESRPQWVCWACNDDMMQDLQRYRDLKNKQLGTHHNKEAAKKVMRFMAWGLAHRKATKEARQATIIQSYVRMRLVSIRFNRRVQKQKRAMVVAVRSASGLPVGDPISRKCQPYVIITVLEPSSEGLGEMQTFFHQLPTKKGGDAGASDSVASVNKKGARAGRKLAVDKTAIFQWEEEFFLPGVSDAATIVFTVLHQAPTRAVCLGQALARPKNFPKTGKHVKTVALSKQQVAVYSGGQSQKDEARITNADWVKPGQITFSISSTSSPLVPAPAVCPTRVSDSCYMMVTESPQTRKSSYCDSRCAEIYGPIAEEVNTLALAESHAAKREESTHPLAATGGTSLEGARGGGHVKRGHPGTAGSHHESAEPSLLTSGSLKGVGGGGGGGGGAVVGGRAGFGLHIKAGDMTTVWWACVWLGRLRLYRNMVDPQPKLNLVLDGWAALAEDVGTKTLRLVSPSSKRWLVLRCSKNSDAGRWRDVLARNCAEEVRQRHGHSHSHNLHDNGPHHRHHHPKEEHDQRKGDTGSRDGDITTLPPLAA
eukprot:jgi/Undpi1/954/HiC_scaffold_10.g04418.m1